jgi:hypothetical protein
MKTLTASLFALLVATSLDTANASDTNERPANVINVVQLDRFSGTIGTHPVQVLLGGTAKEIVGQYHYGNHSRSEKHVLLLSGNKNSSGVWDLVESTESIGANAAPHQTGRWHLEPVPDGWKGNWTKIDGSGVLAITLHENLEAVDYAEISKTRDESVNPGAAECTIHVFRHQIEAEIIDGSNDTEDCEGMSLEFPDLNFDGHADMIHNIDTPLHNPSYSLALYDTTKKRFVDAGVLTQPTVDPVHKNIVVTIHYSCCAHSTAIYRFKKSATEPTLIEEKVPCSDRPPNAKDTDKSCVENYWYDFKTGKIIEGDE